MSLNVLLWVLHWPEAGNFIKKESLAQVFSCEFCEISKSTYFYRTPLVAASVDPSLFLIYFNDLSEELS